MKRLSVATALAAVFGIVIGAPVAAATTITLTGAHYIYYAPGNSESFSTNGPLGNGAGAVGRFSDSSTLTGNYATTLEFLIPTIPSDMDITSLSLTLQPSPQVDGHGNTGLGAVQFRSYLAANTGSDATRLFAGNNLTNNLDLNHPLVIADLFGGPTVNYVYNGPGQYLGFAFRETNPCTSCTSFTTLDFPGATQAVLSITYDTPTPPPTIPSAIPEPATWAMFIGGFGLIGVGMRRRQRVSGSFA
ncbi:PEPxxWA-CTERM sorting domain-containing protein [Sphingomonas sp. BIUV-7]|uniref:PEPxxWA-CTERM sorting domain-containing protein n=1 Tax=Sphingomonas natans TaxID=3063330 RepID=A0ABT8Y7J9_9SPHN|nr:PEPxxWA-CTERM sorting domain-containing protein [Sphingomonas sp. BIUV-7]MDO6414287.1 PEPxxWA-CTERM sorting domain-containing protein [Sphingomonas sp. BIUV-7]